MKRTRTINETIISSSCGMPSGRRRTTSAPGRPGPNPIRASMASMSSSSHDRSNAMSRAANHMSLCPASSSQPASSRPCASNSPRPRWSIAVPAMSSTKWRCRSFGCSKRMLAPYPSTVPMRVSVAISGSGTPGADEEARLFDVRERALPPLDRDVDQLAREPRAVLLPPRVDGRQPEPGPRRDVAAVPVESTVTADTTGDQRLGDGEVGQELVLGELDLRRAHGRSLPSGPARVNSRVYTDPYTNREQAAATGRTACRHPPRRRTGLRRVRVRRHLHGGRGDRLRRHQAHRVPPLRVQGRALPRDPPAGLRRPRTGAPLRAGDADAERPRPTDAPHGGAGGPRGLHAPVAPCGARAAVRGVRRRAPLGVGVGRAPAQRARHRRRGARRLALRGPLRLARRDDAHLAGAG